jgi:hypothetical protein
MSFIIISHSLWASPQTFFNLPSAKIFKQKVPALNTMPTKTDHLYKVLKVENAKLVSLIILNTLKSLLLKN